MSIYNKVVWSEGLFLRPQHFQQQDRYFERYVETRCQALVPHSWGFTDLELERDFLGIGKFGLRARRRRLSRRHAVPDAGRRRRCRADRDRPAGARSDRLSGGAVSPCRAASTRTVPDAGRSGATRRAGTARRAMRRRLGDRCVGARGRERCRHATAAGERGDRGVRVHSARAHRRVPRRQAGRARREVHPDGAGLARRASPRRPS